MKKLRNKKFEKFEKYENLQRFLKKSKLTSEAMEVFLGPTEISERQPTTNLTKVINYQHFYVHNARWKSNTNHHMW